MHPNRHRQIILTCKRERYLKAKNSYSKRIIPRSTKFKFAIGEKVLCYEPDPTKTKVLYESRVLEVLDSGDGRGRKVPEYLIHFLGWNSSWDRFVKEDFILSYTEENRELQSKLANEAALSIKGKRKYKLPPLIKETLNKKICKEGASSKQERQRQESEESSSESDSSEDEEDRKFVLNIPDSLKLQLEEDWKCITQRNKLVKIPCQPNVVSVLEDFVKYLAAKLLCTTPPQDKNEKRDTPEDIETKLILCKEAMDGIRIYFDFTLPHLLLYRHEKNQYYAEARTCKPIKGWLPRNHGMERQFFLKTDSKIVTSTKKMTYSRMDVLPKDMEWVDQSRIGLLVPKIECISPPRSVRDEHKRERHSLRSERSRTTVKTDSASDTEEAKPRPNQPKPVEKAKRGRPKKARRSNKIQKSPAAENSATEKPGVREDPPTRLTRQTSPVVEAAKEEDPPTKGKRKGQERDPAEPMRVTRQSVQQGLVSPSDLVSLDRNSQSVPNGHASSSNCCGGDCSCSEEVDESSSVNQESLLRGMLRWRIVPRSLYRKTPPAPSLVYGPQHLLRLFVNLPDLITQLKVSSRKLPLLKFILESFLMYLVDEQDQLFLPSCYIDSPDNMTVNSPDSNSVN